jgi:hypothetical protein
LFSLCEDHIEYFAQDPNQPDARPVSRGKFCVDDIIVMTELVDHWFEWFTVSNVHGGKFKLHCKSSEIYQQWAIHLHKCGVPVIGMPIY